MAQGLTKPDGGLLNEKAASQGSKSRAFDNSDWAPCLEALQLTEQHLLSISCEDSHSRTYAKGDVVYKVSLTRGRENDSARLNSPAAEFELYKRLGDIKGVPRAIDFRKGDSWTALMLEYFRGKPVVPHQMSWPKAILCWLKVAGVGWRLSRKGVAHNDLKASNILMNRAGQILIIDFDQAVVSGFLSAFARTFLGIRQGGTLVYGTVNTVIKKKMAAALPRRVYEFIRRLQGKNFEIDILHDLPAISQDSSQELKLVYSAWALAQQSHASSPGQQKAYYSFAFEGVHFPGERPWAERWGVLGSLNDFTGLKTLELGCNLALLSAFLLKEGGAAEAMAVDADPAILEAAGSLKQALHVDTTLRQVNFDAEEAWEDELLAFGADVVFALSVLNWVQDKHRFLRFLARHRSAVVEGHDKFSVERDRLRDVGFTDIRLITVSERGRPLLICNK